MEATNLLSRKPITNCHVYIQSELNLYTVGFYDPEGAWHSDSDHDDREEAAKRVAYLNGSKVK